MSRFDYFNLAGKRKFIKEIIIKIREKFDILKFEDDVFCLIGIDVTREGDKIKVSKEEYTNSL